MEIYQLKVFLEVARCLNFTEAADRLNLTQPAVSAKVKSLESELKASLFHRLGRQIQLTELGQYLVSEAESLVELEAEISNKINKFKQFNFNQITIASSVGLAENWLPKIIYQYRQKYPECQVKLETFDNRELVLQAIEQNKIDLAFSEIPFKKSTKIKQETIEKIRYGLIVSSNSPVARKQWQTLEEIKPKSLLLLGDRFTSRKVFESRLAELDLNLTDFPRIETVDSFGLMKAYLMQGDYVGFASDLEFQSELDAEIFTFITLQEFALPANIYVNFSSKKDNINSSTAIAQFLALFPATDKSKPSIFINNNHNNSAETISIKLGIQNGTIPTITAGLILQRLRLLEHFLPRTGRYDRVKYDIQWHNYLSGMPIAEGLKSQSLDIGVLGDYPLLQSAIPHTKEDSSHSTQLVSFVSINPHGDGNAVIVPQTSKLEAIEDLKGETVALPFGSSAHGMLLRTLSNLDLLSKVKLFPLTTSQFKTTSNPKIAAGYAYFSPFHQLASDRGNFKYLFQGNLTQLPGFYGVVVSQSFANKYPELVVSYLQALIAAQYWLANTPSAISLVSKWTKIKPQILNNILSSNNSATDPSLFLNDAQIRSDWLSEHINQLKIVPSLESLQKIKCDRWVQPEFLEFAQQN